MANTNTNNTRIVPVSEQGINNPFAHVTVTDVQFRRKTNRYARQGTFSNNKGYLCVGRDPQTGVFVSVK